MPTAAKLIAGIGLGITAAIAAMIFIGENSEIPLGFRFVGTNAIVGFFAGWYSLGRRPGWGNIAGAMAGIRTLVFLVIGSGMVFAVYHVARNLQQFKSKDVIAMPLAFIEKSFEYVVMSLTVDVAIALVIGGVISGIATYHAAMNWR